MDWLFDNFQVVIMVAAAIAYWLNSRREQQDGEPGVDPFEAEAQFEEERRVQEEIRRKISDRQRGLSTSVEERGEPYFEEPPVVFQPVPPPPVERPRARTNEMREAREEEAQVLDRQRVLAEQIEALGKQRREVARQASEQVWRRPANMKSEAGVRVVASGPAIRGSEVATAFKDRAALRRAFVMKEVLDRPVGLR